MDRRDFLKVLGVTSSTAMLSSCGVDKANEKIIPYVIPPEEEVYPGKPLYVNTTCTECPAGCGLRVTVNEKVYHDVRGLFPTKLEGIEGHPINGGALCMRGQAGLFRLYHPDRIRRPMMRDAEGNLRVATWEEAYQRIRTELSDAAPAGKSNLYLAGLTTGTLADVIDLFCREMKVERLPEYEVFSHANIKTANQIAFNRPEIPHYRIESADFLLTVGADIFETFISPVAFATGFARAKANHHLNWFHIEPHVSLTGSQADYRSAVRAGSEPTLLAYLLHHLVKEDRQKKPLSSGLLQTIPDDSVAVVSQKTGIDENKLLQLKEKLFSAGQPLLIAGGVSTAHRNGLETALLAALLQYAMGMTETTVDFDRTVTCQRVGDMRDITRLIDRLNSGKVGVLFISRTDPVGTLPAGMPFTESLKKAALRVGISDHLTASVKVCDIVLPLSHSLESWGDSIPVAGLRTVMQPALEPQFDTHSEGDILLSLMAEKAPQAGYKEYLMENWNARSGSTQTRAMLQKGYQEETVPLVKVALSATTGDFLRNANFDIISQGPVLLLTPSIRSFDGRSKSLPLLNEIPDPLSTISYGEWVSVSEKMAGEMGLRSGDEVQLTSGEFTARLAVNIQKQLPEKVLMIQRDVTGLPDLKADNRSGEMLCYLPDVNITRTGTRIPLPILAGSLLEEGRGILPAEDGHSHGHGEEHAPWYPEHEHKDYRWGMAIDLESCIGCNACVAACYVENNIPIVGREEHLLGREMSWIRIQPYLDRQENFEFVPMLCQHCDNAPCEPVCPVYAAYHNPEGLNVQVYNRCVGTRYCANNCPYKVRRFNWFDHALEAPWDKMYNPAVSVRDRGIMEKCTFCIQRIRAAKDIAKDEGRLVQDGEVSPACAQTCPTGAITFGNLMDENSKVSKLANSKRAYHALDELGTKPAVSYLRKRGNDHEA